jgi:nicotinate-nucleotide--dimethylbenzimidazole phosphoribosyltransferase
VCVQAPCEPAQSDAPQFAASQPVPKPPVSPEPVQECPADPGGNSCSPPCEPGPVVLCPTPPTTATDANVPGTVPPCEPGPAVTCPAGDTTVPPTVPADLPPEAEARDLAAQLLTASGFEAGEARVEATSTGGAWSVTFEPTLAGSDAPGLAGSVAVGAEGVASATGYFAPGDPLGDYPLLSTRQAIERLNTPGEVTAMDGAVTTSGDAAESAAPATAPTSGTTPPPESERLPGAGTDAQAGVTDPPAGGPDDTAAPAPATVEVTLTGVEVVYTTVPSWDGSGSYVVPGYRFTGENGEKIVVSAVADEALRPPPGD